MSDDPSESPGELPPVEPDDFREAVELGELVLDGEEEDPLERLAEAYAEHFSAEPEVVLSMIVRFFALGTLLDSSRLEPWMQPVPDDPDAVELADAVLYVAADEPLEESGEFDGEGFLDRLESIAPRGG